MWALETLILIFEIFPFISECKSSWPTLDVNVMYGWSFNILTFTDFSKSAAYI